MNVLDNNYQVHGQDASGRLGIVGFVYNDGGGMPYADEFDGFTLLLGSKLVDVTTGAMYYFDGSGNWFRRQNSMFENVYSKAETDSLLNNYYTKAVSDNIMNYILLCNSSLNYISVTDGVSSGYFVQDLPIVLPEGDYIWRMQRDGNSQTSMRVKASDDTSLYNVTRGAGVNNIEQPFTISDSGAKISIYTGNGVRVWGCLIYPR